MQPEAKYAILARMRSLQGDLHNLIAMLEAGEPCEPVIQQLNAVSASLGTAGRILVRSQLGLSTTIILDNPCADERQAELENIIGLFHVLTKYPSLFMEVNK